MPHILEQYTENLGNVVDNEQQTPISERSPKEVIFMNIFTGGEQTSQSGMTHQFKESDLDQVVETYDPVVHLAPLIRGHDERDDGAPSSGWVKKVVRKGNELFAYVALTGFGQQILEEGNFKKVSCRFYPPEDPANPTPGKLSLRHLALVTIPAVKGLQEFSENRDKNLDWDFSAPIEYSYVEENIERKEVKKSILDTMEKLMLDGEDMEPAGESPEVQKMELGEDEEEKKNGKPVNFKPKLVGMTKEPFILDGEDTILEDVEFGETSISKIAKNDDDSETVHDSDTERQKEYRKIIKDNSTVTYTEPKEGEEDKSPMGKIGQLVDVLLKHFSHETSIEPSEPVIVSVEEEGEQCPVEKDPTDMSGYMPLDGSIEIEITKTEDVDMGEDDRCWEGYEPVPGKEPYEDGSCRKESDHGEEMEHGENINEPVTYPTLEEEENYMDEKEAVKKVELVIPQPRKGKAVKKEYTHSYSESINTQLTEMELYKQKSTWNDFAEAYYNEGVLTESIISKEELVDSLMFLDNQTSNLSFSEGQINPLDTFKKLLDRMPPVVGLNGFEPEPKNNVENLFKDQLVEGGDQLVFGENNVAFDRGSLSIHQQALDYSEKHGVDYYSAIQKIIG